MQALGLYLSVPFCRAKCSFCNFASDAFAPSRMPAYVDALCHEIATSRTRVHSLEAALPGHVDTIYFGGGTPSLLSPEHIRRVFTHIRHQFTVSPGAEITVECAPGQISPQTLEELQRQGVNRLSFGVQSFVDRETAAIGRLHTAAHCIAEIERVRSAGILNLSLDLIAGLPHQTESTWRHSVASAVATGVPHLSVYMLEVDEDSRLGREVLDQGSRYGAANVPADDVGADFYDFACTQLNNAGIPQYEISNFARPGFPSAHNLKYWQRAPYLGLGLDAHSMLHTASGPVRFANTADLDAYLTPSPELGSPILPLLQPTPPVHRVTADEVLEEALFLGLRLNGGLSLDNLVSEFGQPRIDHIRPALAEVATAGLLTLDGHRATLTARGRVLSNEVFSRLLLSPSAA